MKKLLVSVVLAVSLLSGCGSAEETPEQSYVKVIREKLPTFSEIDDKSLVSVGKAECGALRRGMTVEEAGMAWIQFGFSGEEAGTVTAAAVFYLCPDQQDRLEEGNPLG